MADGSGERTLYGPAAPQTFSEQGWRKIAFTIPHFYGHCAPIESHGSIASGIIALLKACSPTDVARLVITLIIDSVNAIGWAWTRADIGKECLKAIGPSTTNCNSTSGIVPIAKIVWTFTSDLHQGPDFVFRSAAHTMCSTSDARKFILEATA